MKPVRILCILGKIKNGGAEQAMFSYFRFLDKNKYQLDFIYEEGSTAAIPEDIIKKGAVCYQVPNIRHISKYIKAVQNAIKIGNYEIVHSNINTLSFFSLYAAKHSGVPVRICHNHSMSSPRELKRDIAKKILRPLAVKYSNIQCSCSELSARWMFGNKAVDSGNVTIIRNGVNISAFTFSRQKRDEIRNKYGIGNKTVIGHIGRFVSVKNHRFIVDLFCEYYKHNRDSVLLLVGDGELENAIHSYAKEKKVENAVIFAGYCPDTSGYYCAFDAFVMPSLYEGFPIVLVEACACGLPVILSDCISLECRLTDRVSFLPTSDPRVWAQKLSEIDFSVDRKEHCLVPGGMYDMPTCVKDLEKLYSECLESI